LLTFKQGGKLDARNKNKGGSWVRTWFNYH